MKKKDRHIDLLRRFTRGLTSATEEQELLSWFRNPVSEHILSDYYREKWEESKQKALNAETQCRMFLRIKDQLKQSEQKNGAKQSIHYLFRRCWKYAAVILCCVGGLATYWLTDMSVKREQTFIVSADRGQRANIILPDGTKVWLNSHTILRYGTDYGKDERIVSLEGEAYFEVAKDQAHRFIVRTENGMEVEALGTTFNVKAYHEDNKVVTTLLEGKVKTSVKTQQAILYPDQQVEYNKEEGSLHVSKPENVAYASMWRNDELAFTGETLAEIAVLFKRLYNVEVRFSSERIKQYRFSGVIKNNSLENVIELISLTSPIEYTVKNDTIELREKK